MSGVLGAVVLASGVAGLATGLGGLVVALLGQPQRGVYDFLLGFSAGVMVAVATFGLVQNALERGDPLTGVLGIALGAGVLNMLDRLLPHLREILAQVTPNARRSHGVLSLRLRGPVILSEGDRLWQRSLLVALAIALHNAPEGLAMGTSYMAEPRLGLAIAAAIALHNIPEGIAVAIPFRLAGSSAPRYIGYATLAGLVEPAAAIIGAWLVIQATLLLPWALAFAGGAMLYVVSDELIPESHSHGFEHQATFGFILGFIALVLFLQIL